jgi:hypothetical protein
MINAVIAEAPQGQFWKLFIRTFRFLQTNEVGLCLFQPFEQSILTLAQRVDIPGGDSHSEHSEKPRLTNSITLETARAIKSEVLRIRLQ